MGGEGVVNAKFHWIALLILNMGLESIPSLSQSKTSWQQSADQMVTAQLIKRDIRDKRVLQVMRSTPRHLFVPVKYRHLAYEDHPLPIGYDQTISQPYIVALMTQLLKLTGSEKVLEIGTGSGYQAAILAQLADSCYTMEIVEPLAESAADLLEELGHDNIQVKWGDGYQGWPKHAPYDRIIVTAAPPQVPQALLDQLAVGGRMVIPVGQRFQELMVFTKNSSGITKEQIIAVRFVPMVRSKE